MKKRVRNNHQLIGLAACTFEVQPGAREIQLTPAGLFRARDGRPHDVPAWRIDAAIAARLIARVAARANPLVIDYEHQTLAAEQNGQPAPAAGWFKRLEWREGQGLFAVDVEWTEKAAQMIAAKEYRFISPVLSYDKRTGEVLDLHMAALTNYPAVDGMADLAARAAARFDLTPHHTTEETSTVDREQLIALLGLAADATDEQINTALAALKARADLVDDVRRALGVTEDGSISGAITALKATAAPDLSQYVPRAMYDETRAQLVALMASGETAEIDRLIEEGLADGRIAGKATADWLRGQGLAALKAYLKDAPAVAALTGTQTGGKAPEQDGKDKAALTDEQLAVCKATGLTPEQFRAALA